MDDLHTHVVLRGAVCVAPSFRRLCVDRFERGIPHRWHEGRRGAWPPSRLPSIAQRIVSEIEALATSTDLSIRQIQRQIAGKASRGVVGEITKRMCATLGQCPAKPRVLAMRAGEIDSSRTSQPIATAMTDEVHVHHFVAGAGQGTTPLVLLHGSGGDERDLVPLAELLAPGVPVLSIRGTVGIDGGFAFFHRFPDRTINEADISVRALVLADFIETCCTRYGLAAPPVAVGYSNGAIMAAALLLVRPTLLAGAILLRPLSPFTSDPPSWLSGMPVLIIDGERDSRRSPGDGARLAERLRGLGATVTHQVLPVGHAISDMDARLARTWLDASPVTRPP